MNTICHSYNSDELEKLNVEYIKVITKFIRDNYKGSIVLSAKNIIPDYDLDIYLPELNLAIEFNGLYLHSELFKDKRYHQQKSNICRDNGIQLFMIWEDEWLMRENVVKSMILNKLGYSPEKLYARKCEVRLIDNKKDTKLVSTFTENSHVQGSVPSNVKIGLYHNNVLVSLMTLGVKRKFMNSTSKDGEYELLRFCNKQGMNVVGGASKLFKYFIDNFKWSEITTYADKSYSVGNLYKQLGFQFVHETEPNYYYIVNGKRKHRFGFRKDVLVSGGFDASMTEHEIMLSRNIYRIFNAGNYKYKYVNSKNTNI